MADESVEVALGMTMKVRVKKISRSKRELKRSGENKDDRDSPQYQSYYVLKDDVNTIITVVVRIIRRGRRGRGTRAFGSRRVRRRKVSRPGV